MIPAAEGAESTQDSQPAFAVNPANALQMAGFTTNTQIAPPNLFKAPLFHSIDGGMTWTLKQFLPAFNGKADETSLSFGSLNQLYAATLSDTSTSLGITRSAGFPPTSMLTLKSRPYVEAPFLTTRRINSADRVYVGFADASQTGDFRRLHATIERTLNGAAATPTWQSLRVDARENCSFGLFPLNLATHANGTTYGIFLRERSRADGRCSTTNVIPVDVVVVRDDNG